MKVLEMLKLCIFKNLSNILLYLLTKLTKNIGLDASVCHKDCLSYETSVFYKQCQKDSGFFKCCVRKVICENKNKNKNLKLMV